MTTDRQPLREKRGNEGTGCYRGTGRARHPGHTNVILSKLHFVSSRVKARLKPTVGTSDAICVHTRTCVLALNTEREREREREIGENDRETRPRPITASNYHIGRNDLRLVRTAAR